MLDSPIGDRYSHKQLEDIWSNLSKIKWMRDLWIHLAIYQKHLGIDAINDAGIDEMIRSKDSIDFNAIQEHESMVKHDIVANIHAFADLCPNAKHFIHLGATSNFINDNVDIIRIKDSLLIILDELIALFNVLKDLSFQFIDVPTLAYTHLQKAQLITIGKRFTMWNQDIYLDIVELKQCINDLPFKGIKGTVGSEDTLLKLFNNSHSKCDQLNTLLRNHYSFDHQLIICGQTYSRKYDVRVFQCLSNISQSLYKMMSDFRLLSGKMEIAEHFDEHQVGSSAMPYKKNPITCEKICSLTRYIMNNSNNIANTYINQWLERSLDDSAIKRIIYPESFVLLGYVINESAKCLKSCKINNEIIHQTVDKHMNMIISERIIIEGVKCGYDRQEIHERLRECQVNNIDIQSDPLIESIIDLANILKNPNDYIGRCIHQVHEFYSNTHF